MSNALATINRIRNFSIIAHIDHGKSTLSDRLIQFCGGLSDREMQSQVLDNMDIERERGITIKAQSVSLNYKAKDGETYELNFIDTPGHVDFSYEVSRSLAACEGALLVVDAAQGVEAQTLANTYTAIEQDLEIIPVVNKIDLPQADSDRVLQEVREIVGIDTDQAVLVSAKTGEGIEDLLERLVTDLPAPETNPEGNLQALIIDSWFDSYLGVVSLVRVRHGEMKQGGKVRISSTGRSYTIDGIRVATPKMTERKILQSGQVGMILASIKDIHGAPVGDTIIDDRLPETESLPGFKKVNPQVYAALFPISSDDYENFRTALDKLSLNDASITFRPESSDALGLGFRIGFLGTLHMEIIQERLEREYDLELITTAPTVMYEVVTRKGDIVYISNPSDLPDLSKIEEIREPLSDVNILTPKEFLGNVMQLCVEKRGVQKHMQFAGNQVSLHYLMPMNEIVLDFFDRIKSVSRGYASLDYQFSKFQANELVKVDILMNGLRVDALSVLTHKSQSLSRGRMLTEKLKGVIPRQMFDVAIQAAIGSHIIARQTVKALRKNVTAKCYGGDISRKKKLLEKQKAGKKRMKQIGKVEIPQDAFLAIMKVDDSSH